MKKKEKKKEEKNTREKKTSLAPDYVVAVLQSYCRVDIVAYEFMLKK